MASEETKAKFRTSIDFLVGSPIHPKFAAFITKLSRQFGEIRNKLHWYHLHHNKLRTKPSQPENDPYDPPGAPWENGRGYPDQQQVSIPGRQYDAPGAPWENGRGYPGHQQVGVQGQQYYAPGAPCHCGVVWCLAVLFRKYGVCTIGVR
jgi:hypothetical protein